MKRQAVIWIVVGTGLVAALIFFFSRGKATQETPVLITPSFGMFEVSVTTSGELKAKNSIEIMGPSNARKANIWQMKISDLIPEGSIVKKGDYVAELDKSEITSKIKEAEINLTKFQSQYTQARLDSQLTLGQARDNLVNLKYAMEQRKLEMEESIYESPSTRRQAEIEHEKAKRAYEQEVMNYTTKQKQAEAKMSEVEADLNKEIQKRDEYQQIFNEFTINAPENGMLIYARDWDGKKVVVGSTVSAWEPTVATLPDLSLMESNTYVNEVDIQKIKKGQKVNIGLDADPDKKLSGEVTQVANIGEQRPNMDSKVFEVTIVVNEKDSTLRPAMTTSNKIVIDTKPNTLFIPLDCLHAKDSLSFVFKQDGSGAIKQEVKTGLKNENEVEILQGLAKEDKIYLSVPPDPEGLKWKGL